MENNIPEFFKEMIKKQYGENIEKKILNGYLVDKPVTLRINTIKSDFKKVKEELERNNIKFQKVDWYDSALIIENVKEEKIRELDIYNNGEIYLQSLSSMLPPIVLEPKPGENILDMTAAPGGKTTQIAAISNNEAMITACEKNKIRADRLKYNLEKQCANRVNLMYEDARKLDDMFSFDKILLDAPCSGSGTMNIFQKNFTMDLIKRTLKIQEELLDKALRLLKPGHEMIYSTCSILKEENEDIIQKILKKNKVQVGPIKPIANVELLETKIPGTICVCPSELYEGFFIAKLRR